VKNYLLLGILAITIAGGMTAAPVFANDPSMMENTNENTNSNNNDNEQESENKNTDTNEGVKDEPEGGDADSSATQQICGIGSENEECANMPKVEDNDNNDQKKSSSNGNENNNNKDNNNDNDSNDNNNDNTNNKNDDTVVAASLVVAPDGSVITTFKNGTIHIEDPKTGNKVVINPTVTKLGITKTFTTTDTLGKQQKTTQKMDVCTNQMTDIEQNQMTDIEQNQMTDIEQTILNKDVEQMFDNDILPCSFGTSIE
jgi:hypothetical protein